MIRTVCVVLLMTYVWMLVCGFVLGALMPWARRAERRR